MFNAKDEEIRELLTENSELWLENYNTKMKIFNAIEYIKENANNYYVEEPHYRGVELLNIEELLEILGDKENEET